MKPLRATVSAAVVVLVVATAGPAAAAEQAPEPSPEQLLQAGADLGVRDGYPGVIGLVRNGEDVHRVHAGYGDKFAAVPADPAQEFRIGSNTKAFVATVLLQLQGEGKLSLDDTVATWLPNAVNVNGFDGTKITIRQLLNHTSGLPDYAGDPQVNWPYVANLDPNQRWAPQTLVNIALTHQKTGDPGQKWAYANTNYVLAGMVIKAVTGNEPAAEIQHRIIEPLGLTHTTFPTADPRLPATALHGYFWATSLAIRDVTVSNVQTFGAAGAMVSTLDDLAAFERALFSGRLLAPAQLAQLKTTVPIDDTGTGRYGLGVVSAQTPCGQVWEHSGAVLGFLTLWLTSDDGSKQVVVAANEYHMLSGTRGQQDVGAAAVDTYCRL
ncbi:serine hydrolase domain-containing protein [Labedaea rhizosphaerae]|uniref:D-alanyl-D-alanine carboxypeptidase n=1 Tax=Labedaea rhizosphaerae TaxID=598644 RepID=A0A4R6S722_LABRH|nr:serine hydrolase domain-containing protein [Labedaea rhizosphaerae]TDP95007.1 D-alanyl-D-alanine carboxypeptidase [Labedaea rhizosphaerae]